MECGARCPAYRIEVAPATPLGLLRLMANPDVVLLYKIELRAWLNNGQSRLGRFSAMEETEFSRKKGSLSHSLFTRLIGFEAWDFTRDELEPLCESY